LLAAMAAVALSLCGLGCKQGPKQPGSTPLDEPLSDSTPAPLKTWPAEAIEPVGTWVCPPWARTEDPGHKGVRYEVLWVRADQSIDSRSLQDKDGAWQWQPGDYHEEVRWFAGSRRGPRSVHYYLCTRVPNDNHWCKMLLSPSRDEDGVALELLDLLRPSHEDEPYATAAYVERVLDGELPVNCRYQRIAQDETLSKDEVSKRVRALRQPEATESELR